MSCKGLKVTVSKENLTHYKVFGHFFIDHFFLLYKIKTFLEKKEENFSILIIKGGKDLFRIAPFSRIFYEALFKNVVSGWWGSLKTKTFDVGELLGSTRGSEDNSIYLDRSRLKIKFPDKVLDNGRKLTAFNREMALKLRDDLLTSWHLKDIQPVGKRAVILDRKISPRRLINRKALEDLLVYKGYDVECAFIEDYELQDQIKYLRQFSVVFAACGSSQVHISFLEKGTLYIELCEPGFRYPNTAIYGVRYGVDVYSLCSSLTKSKRQTLEINHHTKKLFEEEESFPRIIRSTKEDVEREIKWYAKLLSPECIHCYSIHMSQDINCFSYVDKIEKILERELQ